MYADSLTGRSAKAELLRISLAVSGSPEMTKRVSPTEKAISDVALKVWESLQRAVWVREWVKVRAWPRSGRPEGPGMEDEARDWARYRAHARPPGVSHKAKTATKRSKHMHRWKERAVDGMKRKLQSDHILG